MESKPLDSDAGAYINFNRFHYTIGHSFVLGMIQQSNHLGNFPYRSSLTPNLG